MRCSYCKIYFNLLYAALVFFMLSACGEEESEAQSSTRVDTFIIQASTFVLTADDPLTIEISGESTKYTFNSDGAVSFTKSNSDPISLNLENSDLVIERPASDAVTVIRND